MNPRASSSETQFTGAEGTVSLGPMSSISFQGRNPWTFEIWIYLDALLDSMNLISRSGEFTFQTQGAAISVSRTNQVSPLTTDDILEPNIWYYVVAAFDGTTLTLYVNGDQQAQMTLNDAGIAPTGSDMVVGGGFYGQVDSARFWSMYLAPGAIYTDQFTDYPSGTTGLVAQMDFTQFPPADTSGNDTPVTVSSSDVSLITFTPALDLTSEGFALPYDDGAVNPAGTQTSFSVMAWVAPSYLSGAQVIFSNGLYASAGMSLGINTAGNVVFRVGSATPITSNAQLSTSSWANVTCTWSESTGAGALFVNGNTDNTGTMAYGSGTSTGAPLIGAAATSGVPSYNFIGYIQSVSVFNTTLSQSTIQTYLTSDPINSSACTADYDFSTPFPQNSISCNPVGLVGGADLTTIITTPDPIGPDVQRPAQRVIASAGEPAGVAPAPVPAGSLTEEWRNEVVEQFRRFMTEELRLPPQKQERYAARMKENLERGARDIAAGTYRQPFRIDAQRRPDGSATLTLHTSEGSFVIYEGLALSTCQQWEVDLIIAILGALVSALGFAKFTSLGQQATSYIANLMSRIAAKIQSIFPSSSSTSPTATMLFQLIKALWGAGALTPLLKFCWEALSGSISAWTIFRVSARLSLFFSPWAAAEVALLVAELGYALFGVVAVWTSSNNCWVSNNDAQPEMRVA